MGELYLTKAVTENNDTGPCSGFPPHFTRARGSGPLALCPQPGQPNLSLPQGPRSCCSPCLKLSYSAVASPWCLCYPGSSVPGGPPAICRHQSPPASSPAAIRSSCVRMALLAYWRSVPCCPLTPTNVPGAQGSSGLLAVVPAPSRVPTHSRCCAICEEELCAALAQCEECKGHAREWPGPGAPVALTQVPPQGKAQSQWSPVTLCPRGTAFGSGRDSAPCPAATRSCAGTCSACRARC